ncbi:MAG: HisA/HisF-related TIM barrel protein, partial [bacterium]|nr:HisA/HisF-related TIM barrel protein [bacterium]
AVSWAIEGARRGAGEILVTSVDKDGTQKGFDLDLIRKISEAVSIPVIAGGGLGKEQDAVDAVVIAKADAVAAASFLHYEQGGIQRIKSFMHEKGISVRIDANE